MRMQSKKFIVNIKKHIKIFYEKNRMLSAVGVCAIGYIVFYYLSFDMPELWENAHIIVDILFQLALALVASIVFYIIQVYVPDSEKRARIRPIIQTKIKKICQYMNDPFQDITKQYLGEVKELSVLTNDDLKKITENYRPAEISTVQVAFECRNLSFDEYNKLSFREMDEIKNELLGNYNQYLTDNQREMLLLLVENSFRHMFDSPVMSLFDSTGIHGDAAIHTFLMYQKIYIELKKCIYED